MDRVDDQRDTAAGRRAQEVYELRFQQLDDKIGGAQTQLSTIALQVKGVEVNLQHVQSAIAKASSSESKWPTRAYNVCTVGALLLLLWGQITATAVVNLMQISVDKINPAIQEKDLKMTERVIKTEVQLAAAVERIKVLEVPKK